jgi:hypothetical protein
VLAFALLLAVTTPAEHIERGQKLLDELEYELAADEFARAAVDPGASDAERIQANLLAGIAHRVIGHDVEARTNFRYVLMRKPDWQIADDAPPKVKLFFESVRQELQAERDVIPSSSAAPAKPAAVEDARGIAEQDARPPSVMSGVAVAAGLIGAIGLVAGIGGVVFAEAALSDPTKPRDERATLRSVGQWSTAVAVVGTVVGGAGTALYVGGLP